MLGADEAGRGPLAGPVAVGAVLVPEGFDVATEFPGVRDSKQLTEKARERIFGLLETRAACGDLQFRVEFEDAATIDSAGIAFAVRRALHRAVNLLAPDAALVAKVQLDGALKAPPEYAQETIIDGDELVPLISLASVAAKVTRDRRMAELALAYPLYGFERHKGYGTADHYDRLRTHGLCAIHRRTFIHLDPTPK